MIISALKCNNCNKIIYSRARHDFNTCDCPQEKWVAIDGGREYTKICYGPNSSFQRLTIDIDVDAKILYNDYNKSKNKYGKFDANLSPKQRQKLGIKNLQYNEA